jgi:Putative MetA-pathway of phenol degradation
MKKIILGTAMLIATVLTVNAQSSSDPRPLKFSVGLEAGLPVGDFKEGYKFGIGGSIQGEYAAAEKLGLTLNAGFLSFTGKTVEILGENYKAPTQSIVPVLAGAKYYFTEKVYGHAQAGISFFNNDGGSAFTYSPGIGINAGENFDILVKYQAATKSGSTVSFIGARVAYNF